MNFSIKKSLSFVILLFSYKVVFTQAGNDTLLINKNKSSVAIYASPNFSFYNGVSKNPYQSDEAGAYSCNFGISINIKIRKHFQFITGFSYTHLRYMDKHVLPFPPENDKRYYDFIFAGIPLQFQYNFIRPNYILFASLGTELNHLVHFVNGIYDSKGNLLYSYNYIQAQSPILPFLISCLGIENRLHKNLFSSLGLGYEYGILPVVLSYEYNEYYREAPQHLYSIFARIGINYKF